MAVVMNRRQGTLGVWMAAVLSLGLAACGGEPEVAPMPEAAPVKVYASRVEQTTARHFVHGQGNAKAVRRELLAFETDGRVAYIKQSAEGRTLQVGDPVRGPDPDQGEPYGELLASLDNRERAASVSASEAALLQTQKRSGRRRCRCPQGAVRVQKRQDRVRADGGAARRSGCGPD